MMGRRILIGLSIGLSLLSCEPNSPTVETEAAPWRDSRCRIERLGPSGAAQVTETACEVLDASAGEKGFRLRWGGVGEVVDGISQLSVKGLGLGKAEVRGLSPKGINSRWGMARARREAPGCWDGRDFKVYRDVKPVEKARCGDHVLLSSKAAMAKSPRPNLDAERLALRISPGLVAQDAAYERIVADLQAIRAVSKGKTVAKRTWPHQSAQGVTLKPHPRVIKAMEAGTYTGLDCLNAWYGGRFLASSPSLDMVFVQFDGWYHGQRIAEAYGSHPDIIWSEPSSFGGAGDDIRLCNDRVGGTHRYVLSHGSGDCPSGCIDWIHRGYDVRADGEVTVLEPIWEIRGVGKSSPRPSWAHDRCFGQPQQFKGQKP